MPINKFSIFNEEEKKIVYRRFGELREKYFGPIARYLIKIGIKADYLTYLGLLLTVPFVYFFPLNPWISFLCMILGVFCDGLDGIVARMSNSDSEKGDFLEHGVDYLVFFIHFLCFVYFGLLDPFWASLYLVSYVVMQGFVIIANLKNVETFPVFRSRLIIYLMMLMWLVSGRNYFDVVLVMMSVYMSITNIFLFLKIKWAL